LQFLCFHLVICVYLFIFRKVRKTSVTWVLVSLCISMLIFNLLFVFGIENSNKDLKTSDSGTDTDFGKNEMLTSDIIDTPNPKCTAIAALLHYFLLVTFTWNGLNATQLYFLLIRTMKPLPRHFILFISLIGWGKCLHFHLLRNLILSQSFNLSKHLLKV
jgi:hypothetical protein